MSTGCYLRKHKHIGILTKLAATNISKYTRTLQLTELRKCRSRTTLLDIMNTQNFRSEIWTFEKLIKLHALDCEIDLHDVKFYVFQFNDTRRENPYKLNCFISIFFLYLQYTELWLFSTTDFLLFDHWVQKNHFCPPIS